MSESEAATALIDLPEEEGPLAPTPETDDGLEGEGDVTDNEEEVPPLAVEDEEETGAVEIEDETAPLASPGVIEGTKHCIFHFLELILAGGTTAYGVGSTRKDKKKVDDLKNGKRG